MTGEDFRIFGAHIPEALVVSWGIVLVLVIAGTALLYSTHQSTIDRPRPLALLAIMLVRTLDQTVEQTMGRDNLWYAPFAGALFAFLLPANLTGLLGLTPPAANILTPVALVTVVFVYLHARGIRAKGAARYLKRFAQPMVFMAPLNIIGEITTPMSMSMRLFGNMLGGSFIMSLLYRVLPLGVPVVPHLYFDVFAGAIQAYIFVMLSMTFTSAALE